ncbi:MAG: Fpg/Nei family DNA glycosylase [Myxococcaceae bacterium]
MPELPDITVYVEALDARLAGQVLRKIRLASPFLVRSADPPIRTIEGMTVRGFRRMGKRIVFVFDEELFLVLHLMIAGRLKWLDPGAKVPGKLGLAAFDFDGGTLILTEASTKKRASLHLVRGEAGLVDFDRGGLEIMGSKKAAFAERLRCENHTLKRSLTDPTLFSGIGNAYSDEILHRAGLSPVKLTSRLTDEEITRLHKATLQVMKEWIARLRKEAGEGFPEKVTAFRPEMAVHGKYRQPCPVCATPVQHIVHAENETNYCPRCQTEGKLLADRSLSKLLKDDWPRSIEELEERRAAARGSTS